MLNHWSTLFILSAIRVVEFASVQVCNVNILIYAFLVSVFRACFKTYWLEHKNLISENSDDETLNAVFFKTSFATFFSEAK